MSQGPCELTQLKMMSSFFLGNRKSISFSPLLPWQLNWMEKTQLMTGKKEQSKILVASGNPDYREESDIHGLF